MEALNDEQRGAVFSSSGPLFVLAGAGTGKTRVIASRIAHLLQSGGFTPANILALTFSRKAAQEMLERVERLHGTYADELGVFTFHGFCHRFLQDHAIELGLPARLRLLDHTESWAFFRGLLPELKLAYHWNLADPTGCIDGFLRLIHRAKDGLVSPREYAAYAKSFSDLQERARAEEVARVYRVYQERMREKGNLDFGDLIVETIRALKERPALLDQVRQRYRAILVDEFQDTNVAQIELLKMLAGQGNDLCVVGDDDQAIYRFRGASFASFLLLKKAYPQVRTVRLTKNYRSTQKILAAAEKLICHNGTDRYDPEKSLKSQGPAGRPVEVMFCRDDADEAEKTVQAIRQILEALPEPERKLREIAVLYRAHSHRTEVTEALARSGIPFFVQGGNDLFDRPEIKDLLAVLRVLAEPQDSVSLVRLMSHPAWGIPAEDLIAIVRLARERQQPLHSVWDDLQLGLGNETGELLRKLEEELKCLRQLSLRSGVQELVPQVAEESFLRVSFRMPGGPLGDPLASLGRFLQLTYRYAQNNPTENRLGPFLNYLDSVEKAGTDPVQDEEEEPGDRIRLMTVHQAKGLEFDWVILLSLVQGRFPLRARSEPIPFPLDLMKEPLPKGDHHLQEERRLCYVACTRARRGLVLMTQDRPRYKPSVFLAEIQGGGSSIEVREEPVETTSVKELKAGDSLAAERKALEIFRKIHRLPPSDKAGFAKALADLEAVARAARASSDPGFFAVSGQPFPQPEKFSFTQLESYRTCPQKYLYAYIYRIPVCSTPQMNFGSDLHECLEKLFLEVQQGRVAPLEELLKHYRLLYRPGRYGEPSQDDRYRQLGEELLAAFYRRHEGKFQPPLFIEKSFVLKLEDASIHGVIDRVDPLDEKNVEILDYKSGKPKAKASFKEQLQLWLYALAAKEVMGVEPAKVSFYYLQDNSRLTFDRKPETLDEARREILEIVRAIRSGKFSPDPDLMKCRWCDFRRLCPSSLA